MQVSTSKYIYGKVLDYTKRESHVIYPLIQDFSENISQEPKNSIDKNDILWVGRLEKGKGVRTAITTYLKLIDNLE